VGIDRTERRKDRVLAAEWLPFPSDFLRSIACAELSPMGMKLLIDLSSQLRWNGKGNGDTTASIGVLRARGWTSPKSLQAAMKELEDARLMVYTRRGDRRRCSLVAITLWPLHCDPSKIDIKPGAYTCGDWMMGGERAKKPTTEAPAKWNRPRKGEARGTSRGDISASAAEQPKADLLPQRKHKNRPKAPRATAAESNPPISTLRYFRGGTPS
jgi:hypothetical protein